jgi:hypothetical protein
MISIAIEASISSIDLDIRILACAVLSRIIVSSVRAVMGNVRLVRESPACEKHVCEKQLLISTHSSRNTPYQLSIVNIVQRCSLLLRVSVLVARGGVLHSTKTFAEISST